MVNAANEAAVKAFLEGELHFTEIVPACRSVLEAHHFEVGSDIGKIRRARSLGAAGGHTLGMCLIGMLSLETILWLVPVVLKVAVGLGMVIFVHELGHFLVAKGVRREVRKVFYRVRYSFWTFDQ